MARLTKAATSVLKNAVGKSKSARKAIRKQVVKQVAGLGEEVVTNHSIREGLANIPNIGKTAKVAGGIVDEASSVQKKLFDNVRRGLKSNFKDVSDDVLDRYANKFTDKILQTSTDNADLIAEDRTLFSRMLRTQGAETIEDAFSTASLGADKGGWIGTGKKRAQNFNKMVVDTELRGAHKLEELNKRGVYNHNKRISYDIDKKASWDVNQQAIQDLREGGFSKREAKRAVNRLEEEGNPLIEYSQDRQERFEYARDKVFDIRAQNQNRSRRSIEREYNRRQKRAQQEATKSGSGNNPTSEYDNTVINRYKKKEFDLNYSDIKYALGYDNLSDEALEALGRKAGFTKEKQFEEFKNFFNQGNKEAALDMVRKNEGEFISNVSLMDKVFAYRVPQKAAFGVGTAYLVSAMANRKGQQSNAELYGQRTPYM